MSMKSSSAYVQAHPSAGRVPPGEPRLRQPASELSRHVGLVHEPDAGPGSSSGPYTASQEQVSVLPKHLTRRLISSLASRRQADQAQRKRSSVSRSSAQAGPFSRSIPLLRSVPRDLSQIHSTARGVADVVLPRSFRRFVSICGRCCGPRLKSGFKLGRGNLQSRDDSGGSRASRPPCLPVRPCFCADRRNPDRACVGIWFMSTFARRRCRLPGLSKARRSGCRSQERRPSGRGPPGSRIIRALGRKIAILETASSPVQI